MIDLRVEGFRVGIRRSTESHEATRDFRDDLDAQHILRERRRPQGLEVHLEHRVSPPIHTNRRPYDTVTSQPFTGHLRLEAHRGIKRSIRVLERALGTREDQQIGD